MSSTEYTLSLHIYLSYLFGYAASCVLIFALSIFPAGLQLTYKQTLESTACFFYKLLISETERQWKESI